MAESSEAGTGQGGAVLRPDGNVGSCFQPIESRPATGIAADVAKAVGNPHIEFSFGQRLHRKTIDDPAVFESLKSEVLCYQPLAKQHGYNQQGILFHIFWCLEFLGENVQTEKWKIRN